MADISLSLLFTALFVLLLCSAFFSGSETALMALNRYRMRHLAERGHRGALLAQRLLDKPDRLIGVILLGNNIVNILITQLATYLGFRIYGEVGIAIATGLLTFVILIFAEVAPKTLGALHSERIAWPAAFIYTPLLIITRPLVWFINLFANSLLRLFGVRAEAISSKPLSSEELRTVVAEAGSLIPGRHQKMLLNLLDLERRTVEDIMVPRVDIVGIDLDDGPDDVRKQILAAPYTRVPVYNGDIDHIAGFLHLRTILPLVQAGPFTADDIRALLREPYFIPEGTTLNRQILNFQSEQNRIGLIVDEYGDILGLVTLEDILEEVVGEFTSDPAEAAPEIRRRNDGSYLVYGGITLRDLNRALGSSFSLDGPRTLNGLILERLEAMPEAGISLLIDSYPVEIVQVKDNAVRTARIGPRIGQNLET